MYFAEKSEVKFEKKKRERKKKVFTMKVKIVNYR